MCMSKGAHILMACPLHLPPCENAAVVNVRTSGVRTKGYLDLLHGASLAVVDLAPLLTALVAPGEVKDGNNEEAVGAVCNTGECVVPGCESGKDAESATSTQAWNVAALEV